MTMGRGGLDGMGRGGDGFTVSIPAPELYPTPIPGFT